MKKAIILILVGIMSSCDLEKDVINPLLLKEIKDYIRISEDYAKTTSTYVETDVYIVMFKVIDSVEYVKIFENNFYDKKDLDGYLAIGDNKVFFYNSNDNFVCKDLLESPNITMKSYEGSKTVEDALDSTIWYFVIQDFKLNKINDENFFFY